jgi:hypothetical protein
MSADFRKIARMGIFRGDVKEETEKLVITERHFERRFA